VSKERTHRNSSNNIECVALKVVRQIEDLTAGRKLIESLQQQVNARVHVRFVGLDRAHRIHTRYLSPHHAMHGTIRRTEQVMVWDPRVSPSIIPFALRKRRRNAINRSYHGRVVDAVHLRRGADDFHRCAVISNPNFRNRRRGDDVTTTSMSFDIVLLGIALPRSSTYTTACSSWQTQDLGLM
jgi:hypothetical protein